MSIVWGNARANDPTGTSNCTRYQKVSIAGSRNTSTKINVSGDSDDERNSRILLETMDTDQCIQKLVRTDQEGSECAQRNIEETVQYWAV